MKEGTYNTLKTIFSALPFIAGALSGIGKLLDNEPLILIGAILGVVASACLKWLAEESKRYFADKDIVPAGHITFVNPELHEGEEDPTPIPAEEVEE